MINLLIQILILLLIGGLLVYVVRLFPLPHPFPQVAQAVIVVFIVIALIYLLMPLGGVSVR